MDMVIKNLKRMEFNKKIFSAVLNTQTTQIDDLMECKCLCCYKNCHKKFDENLKKRLANTYKSSNHDINKFILLADQQRNIIDGNRNM